MNHPLDLIVEDARDLARGLVAQLPFLAVAATVFVAFLLPGRLLRRVVRQALRRHDPAFAEMVARLDHVTAAGTPAPWPVGEGRRRDGLRSHR